jgi:hypothetical protein
MVFSLPALGLAQSPRLCNMLEAASISFRLIFPGAQHGEARFRRITENRGRVYWVVSVYHEADFGLEIFKRYHCPRLVRAIQLVEELARIHPHDVKHFNEFRMSCFEVEMGASLDIMKERHGV